MNKLLDHHYTYFSGILEPDKAKIVTAIILGVILYIIGCILRIKLNSNSKLEKEVVPSGKFTCFSFFDFPLCIFNYNGLSNHFTVYS